MGTANLAKVVLFSFFLFNDTKSPYFKEEKFIRFRTLLLQIGWSSGFEYDLQTCKNMHLDHSFLNLDEVRGWNMTCKHAKSIYMRSSTHVLHFYAWYIRLSRATSSTRAKEVAQELKYQAIRTQVWNNMQSNRCGQHISQQGLIRLHTHSNSSCNFLALLQSPST